MIRDGFYPVSIELSKIKKGQMHSFDVGAAVPVVVFYRGSELIVMRDFCPHMGAPLSDGKLSADAETIQCPWHGYFFSTSDGTFQSNPNDRIFDCMKEKYKSYDASKTPKYKIQVLPFEIIEDKLWVLKSKARVIDVGGEMQEALV